MAQAVYKNIPSDYKNMSLMMALGVALSTWRENYGANEYGEFDEGHKQLTVGALAKAIGERYDRVYRIEHGAGTSIVFAKYIMLIKQLDPSFNLIERVKDIMGDKYPKFDIK